MAILPRPACGTGKRRVRPLPEIDGKVELYNKGPFTDGCARCVGCCGIKLSIIQSTPPPAPPPWGKIAI
jgi:hypothetical protein